MRVILFLLCLVFSLSTVMGSESHQSVRPDQHAPISVMCDHVHVNGEFMWSYRYMQMTMLGVLNGVDSVSYETYNSETSYMKYLDSMNMTMHMLGVMYAQSEKLTWMLMLPYINNDMTVKAKMGGALSSMTSTGIGDLKFGPLYSLINQNNVKSHINLTFSLPTGAIDVKDSNMTVGYPMQLGSGTFDLKPSLTIVRFFHDSSIGFQFNATLRTGQNNQGYRLGHSLNNKLWIAKTFGNYSFSSSLIYQSIGSISGQHSGIMSVMNAALDASNSGQDQVTSTFGMNVAFDNGYRLALEYLLPVVQSVTGYQMDDTGSFVFGIQKAY